MTSEPPLGATRLVSAAAAGGGSAPGWPMTQPSLAAPAASGTMPPAPVPEAFQPLALQRFVAEGSGPSGRYAASREEESVLFAFDRDWRFTAANHAAEAVTGYARAQLMERTLWDLVPPKSRMRVRRQCLSGRDSAIDLEILTSRGEARVLHLTWWESPNPGGAAGYFAMARDITAQVTAERFEKARQRVLQMLVADEPLREILAFVSNLTGEEIGDSRCVIHVGGDDDPHGYAHPADLARETLTGACPLRPQLTGPRAIDERTNITLCPAEKDQEDYRWQWMLPVTEAKRGSRITVFRKDSGAPQPHHADLLVKTAGLLGFVLAHHRLTSQLRHQAHHDALTGLPNRVLFRERLTAAISEAAGRGLMAGILYVDLDDFKLINDSAGHLWGDRVLERVAHRMRAALSADVFIARVGGDEFNVLVRNARSAQEIRDVAEQLLRSLDEGFDIEGSEQFIAVTVGMSVFPADGQDAELLLKHADAALYQAKAEGKSQALFYEPNMAGVAVERLSIQNQLRRAIERNELHVRYQPQLCLKTGGIAGYEALLRWDSRKLGTVSPAAFIPVAESSGLIIPIGKWLLETVCEQILQWAFASRTKYRIAVNVSAVQFRQPDFPGLIFETLRKTGVDPRLLELELTESVIMREVEESVRKIVALREFGVAVSIDDFGTGYSSLNYLERLPVDALKIDQSFTRRIQEGQPQPALIQAIIGLGHNLGMAVTAEGVETEYQLNVLRDLGCDKAQGYLLGGPADAGEALRLISEHRSFGPGVYPDWEAL